MDAIDLLLDAFGEDGTLLAGLLGVAGAALLAVLLIGVLSGRKDVRRRVAAEDAGAGSARALGGAGRVEAQRSLDRLMTYMETTFAGSNERESRVLRRQLIQAGFFDNRAVSVYFGPVSASPPASPSAASCSCRSCSTR